MRNRAKCKLCKRVIESLAKNDYVSCECGEISISGGNEELKCYAQDFANFLRIDDDGNEVVPKVIETKEDEFPIELTREEKLRMINSMLKYYEEIPPSALMSTPSHYDIKTIYVMLKGLI